MTIGIRGYASSWSCVAGNALDISMASDSPLGSGVYKFQVRNGIGGAIKYGPVDIDKSKIPVQAVMPRHADEQGYFWPVVVNVPTDITWNSGPYVGEVLLDGGVLATSRVYFVVRSPRPGTNSILIHYPFTTAYAYDGFFGARSCLYDSDEHFRCRRITTRKPLVASSGTDLGGDVNDSCSAAFFQNWLKDKLGLGADACSSWDLHSDPSTLSGYRMLILAGHDEYWSLEMRQNVEAFIASGGHMAVFSGNNCWWQIRFSADGSQIICHKSVLEDPLLGPDRSRVSGNWSSWPAGNPENRMTGVGFRYGFQRGSGPIYVVPPRPGEASHPAFAGLAGQSFGAGLGGEADGVDLDFSDPQRPKPTFRDGTPDNFKVLAYSAASGDAPPGRAIIGYYTNVGTVFACPVTAWIEQIAAGDGQLEIVTANVVQWLLSRSAGPTSGPGGLVTPPASWTKVDSGDFKAVTGSLQGRVFAAQGNSLYWRHPDMASGWQEADIAIPIPGSIDTLGTDLYTYYFLVAIGNRLLLFNLSKGPLDEPILSYMDELDGGKPGESFVGVTGTDHNGVVYAALRTDSIHAELRARPKDAKFLPVGDATGLRCLTAADGYLVASTTSGRLVARMGGSLIGGSPLLCDLTWFDIGEAPEILSLAHYFGILYGLAASSEGTDLMWRQIRPDTLSLPANHGRLLFYNDKTGACDVGRFLGNGDYEQANEFVVGANWTHVTRVNHRLIFFYNSIRGDGLLGQVEADGSWTEVGRPTGFGRWDLVVTDGDYVFFYKTGSSDGYVGNFDWKTGEYKNTDYRSDFSPNWKLAAALWGVASPASLGSGKFIVLYADDGTVAIGDITSGKFVTRGMGSMMPGADALVPAGQLGVFAYQSSTGKGEFGEALLSVPSGYKSFGTWPDFEQLWKLGAGRNGLVFFYRKDTGVSVAGGFSRGGEFTELNRWDPGAFASGWSHIVGIDSSPGANPLLYVNGPDAVGLGL